MLLTTCFLLILSLCSTTVGNDVEILEVEEVFTTYSLLPVSVTQTVQNQDTNVPQYVSQQADTPTAPSPPSTPSVSSGGCECAFPQDANLTSVTPNLANAGWAMSPDMKCTCGTWCQYACPAGFQSVQWDTAPNAGRMDGGLYCNAQGELERPRPSQPLCRDFSGEVSLKNIGRDTMHVCQTVFPGTENMLIPNKCPPHQAVPLAIPDSDAYNAPGTNQQAGAHFYINAHGISQHRACSWGTKDDGPHGNWAPYVLGTNRGSQGEVFLALSWNPVYLEHESPYNSQLPNFGVKIDCHGNTCNNEECAIDPRIGGINDVSGVRVKRPAENPVKGPAQAYCIASVPQGAYAEVLIFEV